MTPAQKYENDKLDINALTETDVALDDTIPVSDASASNEAKKLAISRLLNMSFPAQGRLTLESGVPCSVDNQTAKTSLYYTPYSGNHVSIYDGTRWVLHSFSELTLSLSGYTASTPYDVWIYSNSGAATLDSTAWTNDTTRSTGLALQDGIYVKDGDSTRRYLGTIRITGVTGQCEDSYNNRFVWNYYNRIKRPGFCGNTTNSWTYTTAAWRENNNGTGQLRFTFVVGVAEVCIVMDTASYVALSASGNSAYAGMWDSSMNHAYYQYMGYTYTVYYGVYGPNCVYYPPIGVTYITSKEYCVGGTMTNYGYGSTTSPGDSGSAFEWEG